MEERRKETGRLGKRVKPLPHKREHLRDPSTAPRIQLPCRLAHERLHLETRENRLVLCDSGHSESPQGCINFIGMWPVSVDDTPHADN